MAKPQPAIPRTLILRACIFSALAAGFAAGCFAIPRISYHFARLQPENYRYVAQRALAAGDFKAAEEICRRRIAQEFYDFEAHYLLAEALSRAGRADQASAVMKDVIARLPGARTKGQIATGYDEARTFQLLSVSLWQSGRYAEAAEMGRAALDTGTAFTTAETTGALTRAPAGPAAAAATARFAFRTADAGLFSRCLGVLRARGGRDAATAALLQAQWCDLRDRRPLSAETLLRAAISTDPSFPPLRAALANVLHRAGWKDASLATATDLGQTTGVRQVSLGAFQFPIGAVVTAEGLRISRTGAAAARVNTGVFRVNSLLVNAAGTQALGLYPIIIIRNGTAELTRLYLDSETPQVFDLHLWPEGAPKNLDLRIEFINDAYDPVTGADRNVTISDIALY